MVSTIQTTISPTLISRRLRQICNLAKATNPWDNAVLSSPPTVTASASADASTTVATTIINSLSSCALYGAKWTSNGTAMVPTTTTRSDASTFAYSGVLEMETDAPTVSVGFLTSNIDCLVEVNGQFVSKTPTTRSGSGTQYVVMAFGSSAVRRIRIFSISPARFIYLPPLYKVWAPSNDDVIRCVITGDSYTAATGPSSVNLSWANIFGTMMGWRDTRACGIGGTGYLAPGTGSAWTCRSHISDVTSVSPDIAVFAHGVNDASYSPSSITAEALLCYQAVRAANANTVILAFGPWPAATGPSASILAVDGAISAAVSAMNDPLCKYIPTSVDPAGSWFTGTGRTGATNGTGNADLYIGGVSGTDTVHPNDAGSLYLARRAAVGARAALMSLAA